MIACKADDAADARSQIGPDLVALLDCLVHLDGKVRIIVDRFGRIVARPRVVSGIPETLSFAPMDTDLRPGNKAPHSGLAHKLLGVRAGETEVAILGARAQCDEIVIRASALDERHVCITFVVTGRIGANCGRELQQLFGLTSSEAHIVVDLMLGNAPQAIARNRGNSIHTVRAHIRQCHHKIGAKTREEMLSRVATLCL